MRSGDQEQRRNHRSRRGDEAWIEFVSGDCVPCVLSDISESGARVTGDGVSGVPAVFNLLLAKDGSSRRLCHVVWRDDTQLGVQFS